MEIHCLLRSSIWLIATVSFCLKILDQMLQMQEANHSLELFRCLILLFHSKANSTVLSSPCLAWFWSIYPYFTKNYQPFIVRFCSIVPFFDKKFSAVQ
uniref:Uncharacterized protein n=1 Tax=Rhizophora mucronata TaxID=61149 RepID=A0A2P2M874_RHIMU